MNFESPLTGLAILLVLLGSACGQSTESDGPSVTAVSSTVQKDGPRQIESAKKELPLSIAVGKYDRLAGKFITDLALRSKLQDYSTKLATETIGKVEKLLSTEPGTFYVVTVRPHQYALIAPINLPGFGFSSTCQPDFIDFETSSPVLALGLACEISQLKKAGGRCESAFVDAAPFDPPDGRPVTCRELQFEFGSIQECR
jgi:hypothetical protein